MRVVWFKRDLRVVDHAPLAEAAAAGPTLPLLIVEPDYWRLPDVSGRQYAFFVDCVETLHAALAAMGQPLIIRVGDAATVLEDLRRAHGVTTLLSHEETGGAWTYDRDKRVAAWARDVGVDWVERRQSGVIRAIGARDGWAKRWDAFMAKPIIPTPAALAPIPDCDPGVLPSVADLGVAPDPCPERQPGGRPEATALLDSFLAERGVDYRRAMSSPIAGWTACSRLSPHLAWGTLSSREAAHALWAAKDRVRGMGRDAHPAHAGSLKSFEGRLHWRCHFMQKLEREPRLEFENLHPAYDAIRNGPPDAERLERWDKGETGWPFVDACMRALRATGWMNFRMRAMLMATASYHLWLPWRPPAVQLARLFTDFEPGIHYPQAQMQSGVTGINTVRIYNPVKQGRDQDPDADFIARWVPELAGLAPDDRHEPWRVGGAAGYPAPILDHMQAARDARAQVWAIRRGGDYRATANAIQDKHGSRKSGLPPTARRKPRRRAAEDAPQMALDV